MEYKENRYLYKYLRFSTGSLATIKDGTIKFTKPIDFNDPFDCFPEIDLDSVRRLPKENPDLFKKAGDKKGLSPAQRIQNKNVMLKNLENKIKDGTYSKEMVANIGICCLSRNPLNILMWSHYSNNHEGFCLEFSVPFSGLSQDINKYLEWLVPHPVLYEKSRPLVNINERSERKIDQQFLIKSKDWEYEQEERVIDHKRGEGIHFYNRKKILSSVIAGMKMSNSNYEKLEKTIKDMNNEINSNIKLYKASHISRKFALYVPNHPRLSKKI